MNSQILIADDDVLIRLQLRELLESVGYTVIEASNGVEALKMYQDLHPDMVLLDAMMPEMDGFECCRRLRELASKDELPILMVTALYDVESVEKAFAVGTTDYITKPIQWLVLRQRVQRLLHGSQTLKQLKTQTRHAEYRESQLRMVLEAAQMGTWEWDINSDRMVWSDNLIALLGDGELPDTLEAFLMQVHPQDRDSVRHQIQAAIASGGEYEIEFRMFSQKGDLHWIVSKGLVIRDGEGKPICLSGVDMDITERKLAESQLRLSEERFQILAKATNDAVWDWNLQTNTIWWNESVESLFGYGQAEVNVIGNEQWWSDHIHPQDRPRVVKDIFSAIDGNQNFWYGEYRFLRANGKYADILDRGYIVRDENGQPVRMIGAMMDITDRKQAQIELQRQNLRSQLFADISLKIRQSLQIEEILQTSVTEVQNLLQADRVVIIRFRSNGMLKVVQEAVVPGFVAVWGQDIFDPCFDEEYINKYRQGHISSIEDIYTADIQPCHVEFLQQFQVRANLVVPIFIHNQLWGLLIAHQCSSPRTWTDWETQLLRQLSDQIGIALAQAKLLEQETKQRQELARSNEELQNFAFIASHDLQEPLRKIKAFGDRLRINSQEALGEQGLDYLERMRNATERMQALIDDLLSLSRVTTRAQPFIEVNLTQLTQEVVSDLEVLIQQTNGTVEIDQLPNLNADPSQIRQLLQNLISNALKFHRPEVPPYVKIYYHQLTTGEGIEEYQIIIEDNGIGFDQKYVDRIFNIFQRLHGRHEYEGTGIGLAICRKIVERHQGTITAESQPGKGSKFIVTLPRNLPN
ncbi:PAS domain-containing protein [Calothrix sp. NIES-3974]|uniref:PAS domain-containing protein n=1 Tax=Calothrix sp. NIES-3974 TaxID=2005462 RepID=UPI000B617134|nr:PAS domain-containing protein [Calothrix sp. NIES-3974]BAZ04968.1 multi-sensor signal transduction histidine kinase [Calothrix sp. NIES-3974]